jgi:hypothetical protein
MTDAIPPSLHPSLRRLGAKQQRLMLMLSMLLFLTISGGMIAMIAIAFSGGDLFNLLLLGVIGLIMMPVVALLSWLLRYLDRWLSRQLDRASQLLRENQPLSARLVPTGLNSKTGTLVTLHPMVGKQAHADPFHADINPSFRWSRPPRQETTVELYCQELKPDNELVAFQPDGSALLGKVVTLEAYQRQMRWTRIALTILLALLLAILGVLANRI